MPICNDHRYHTTQADADACLKHPALNAFDLLSTESRVAGLGAVALQRQQPGPLPPPPLLEAPRALTTPSMSTAPRVPALPARAAVPASTQSESIEASGERQRQNIMGNRHQQQHSASASYDSPPPPPTSASTGVSVFGNVLRWQRGMPSPLQPPQSVTSEPGAPTTSTLDEAENAGVPTLQKPVTQSQRALPGPERRDRYERSGAKVAISVVVFLCFLYWFYHYVLFWPETCWYHKRRGELGLE